VSRPPPFSPPLARARSPLWASNARDFHPLPSPPFDIRTFFRQRIAFFFWRGKQAPPGAARPTVDSTPLFFSPFLLRAAEIKAEAADPFLHTDAILPRRQFLTEEAAVTRPRPSVPLSPFDTSTLLQIPETVTSFSRAGDVFPAHALD